MINKKSATTLRADITIGLNKGYSKDVWILEQLKTHLTNSQKRLKEKMGILLSAKVTLCDIVFLGQDEPSATLSFINYPKFPITEDIFKKGVNAIAKDLMEQLEQNRIVVIFDDETVMFEQTDEIDKSIDLN